MAPFETVKVSSSGQMRLPDGFLHRWRLDQGGEVDVLDLDFGLLTVPAGYAGRFLDEVLPSDEHHAVAASE